MDWLDQVNGAMDYIEDNLTGEIRYEELARRMACSTFHFQRMFPYLTGIPLSEYIRRRRLSMAAEELQRGGRVLDVALRCGYESPESFSRAFRRLHGISPSEVKDGVAVKCYPRLSFQISIKGETALNFRIEEKGPFTMHGVTAVIDKTDGNNFLTIPQFWQQCYADGTVARLLKELCGSEYGCLHAGMYGFQDSTFTYMIGALGDMPAPAGCETLQAPAATWAIFRTEDHPDEKTVECIQTLTKRIFSEWFPSSGYQHENAPEFEMYHANADGTFYSEVWIPVVKK